MGFSKHLKNMRRAIRSWDCHGFLGYGQGKAVSMWGEEKLRGRSACIDICSEYQSCRRAHHNRMDHRYPQLAQVVAAAARTAQREKVGPLKQIMESLQRCHDLGLAEATEVKRIVKQFGVDSMTDHYRAGQFENIQNGLDGRRPDLQRPIPPEDGVSVERTCDV